MKDEIVKTVDILKRGGTILYPTDTIWGLGCEASNVDAIHRILAIKKRPNEKSLIILADDVAMMERYVRRVPPVAYDLIRAAIKPLTIIYPEGVGLPTPVIAEDGSVAIRVVRQDFCREVIKLLGNPIVSTSANISGFPSPATFSEIAPEIIDQVDYAVEEERDIVRSSVPSTLIRLKMNGDFEVLRD